MAATYCASSSAEEEDPTSLVRCPEGEARARESHDRADLGEEDKMVVNVDNVVRARRRRGCRGGSGAARRLQKICGNHCTEQGPVQSTNYREPWLSTGEVGNDSWRGEDRKQAYSLPRHYQYEDRLPVLHEPPHSMVHLWDSSVELHGLAAEAAMRASFLLAMCACESTSNFLM